MTDILPMPKPPGRFSPWRKTAHFLLLLGVIDIVAITVIVILAKLTPATCFGSDCGVSVRELFETAGSRIAGLMNLNSAAISLYAGLISYKERRNGAPLLFLSIIISAVALFLSVIL